MYGDILIRGPLPIYRAGDYGSPLRQPHRRPRRRALPALYGVPTLPRSVAELREELAASDSDRFLTALNDVEGAALRLLDQMEQRADVFAH